MCGRFTLTVDRVDKILKKFNAESTIGSEEYKPRYNISPGQTIPAIVTKENGKRYLMNMFWGFIPPWGEKPDGSIISQANIRNDTISKNKYFQDCLLNKRCIIVADGFYEWKKPSGFEHVKRGEKLPKGMKRIPYYISLKGRQLFSFAALYRSVMVGGKVVLTTAIITTQPNALIDTIHDRMPVILEDEDVEQWLNPDLKFINLMLKLLDPYPADKMEMYPVSFAVNNSQVDSPICIEPFVR